MTRAECILAAITKELDRRFLFIEKEPDLMQVVFCVKFKKGIVQRVQVSVDTDREIGEKSASVVSS